VIFRTEEDKEDRIIIIMIVRERERNKNFIEDKIQVKEDKEGQILLQSILNIAKTEMKDIKDDHNLKEKHMKTDEGINKELKEEDQKTETEENNNPIDPQKDTPQKEMKKSMYSKDQDTKKGIDVMKIESLKKIKEEILHKDTEEPRVHIKKNHKGDKETDMMIEEKMIEIETNKVTEEREDRDKEAQNMKDIQEVDIRMNKE